MLEVDDDGDRISLKCKICTVNINEIRNEAKKVISCDIKLVHDLAKTTLLKKQTNSETLTSSPTGDHIRVENAVIMNP